MGTGPRRCSGSRARRGSTPTAGTARPGRPHTGDTTRRPRPRRGPRPVGRVRHPPLPPPRCLAIAERFGVDLTIDVATTDPVRALRQAGFRGTDVVVDVIAKAPAALAQAIGMATTGARVVLAGTRRAG